MNETNLHDSLAVAFNITHVRAMSVGFFGLFIFVVLHCILIMLVACFKSREMFVGGLFIILFVCFCSEIFSP